MRKCPSKDQTKNQTIKVFVCVFPRGGIIGPQGPTHPPSSKNAVISPHKIKTHMHQINQDNNQNKPPEQQHRAGKNQNKSARMLTRCPHIPKKSIAIRGRRPKNDLNDHTSPPTTLRHLRPSEPQSMSSKERQDAPAGAKQGGPQRLDLELWGGSGWPQWLLANYRAGFTNATNNQLFRGPNKNG